MRIIQLGITLSDAQGRKPEKNPSGTWQFNFHFDLNNDQYATDAIAMLRSAGLDFHKHASSGIDVTKFGE